MARRGRHHKRHGRKGSLRSFGGLFSSPVIKAVKQPVEPLKPRQVFGLPKKEVRLPGVPLSSTRRINLE